jgi:putative ABC transport system permease protein
MQRIGLWLRWSARDLRRRWLVVAALALVIAIGTGTAAAFTSLSEWRRVSNDVSFEMLGFHDLMVSFPETGVPADRALAAVRGTAHPETLDAIEARLDVPTQVAVTTGGQPAVLPGRIVGVDLAANGPLIDKIDRVGGRSLTAADAEAARPTGMVETAFADRYHLPTTGTVRVAGDIEVDYVGLARSPEYLLNGNGAILGEETRAVLFLPLPVAQWVAGTDQVNRVLITLRPGTDAASARREVTAAVRAALPDVTSTVSDRDDDTTYRMLYRDIENDQQMWDVIALLVLGGAALATFNLSNRVIASQRREIGVGAALGLPTPWLAARPLLFGTQIAVLGSLTGIGVGALLGWAITGILDDLIPLPQWRTPFQFGPFLRATALGLTIPLLGVAYPVWRALRVTPAEAIRTAHITGRAGALSRALRRVPLPGSSIGHLPFRHVLRAPGRTALTAAGIGAAVTVLVAMLGLLDSFRASIDAGEREIGGGVPGRTVVTLDTFRPVNDPAVAAIGALPEVATAQPGLRVTGSVSEAGKKLDLVIDVLDFRNAIWTPSDGRDGGSRVPDGLVLARKAAEDLGVGPGDSVLVEHPRRTGAAGFTTVTTRMRVAGVHPYPMRPFAYLDAGQASVFGLDGVTNLIQVAPANGVSEERLRRALLANRSVASAQPVTAISRAMRDLLAEFTDILGLLEVFVLVLALLIAFNASSVSADERAREHATMFAFGLRTGTVLRNSMAESLLIGLLGTGLGLLAGTATIWWMVGFLVSDTMPELAVYPTVGFTTILTALAVGVAAVTIAPLLTVRRLRRTDVPATLRVVE